MIPDCLQTGEIVAEASDASGTGYFDSANQCWDRDAMKVIDEELENWVPRLIKPSAKVGELKPGVACKLLGSEEVPERERVPSEGPGEGVQ